MRKILAGVATIIMYLGASASNALADVEVSVPAPSAGIKADAKVGVVIGNALTIAYAIGALLVLFFLIMGAFNWITSGGDKEKVANARKSIFAALTGLAVLALAALITNTIAGLLGFGNVLNFTIPSLGRGA